MTAKFLVKSFGKKGLGRVEGMQSVVSSLGVMILGGNGQVLVCSRKCLKSSLPPQLCCPGVGCYSFCVADSGGGWSVGAW